MKYSIILFDSPCVMCNFWVNKLCQWDKKDCFRFASLESKVAADLLNENKIKGTIVDSIYVCPPNELPKNKAAAVFYIVKKLGGFYNLFLLFDLLPRVLTNKLYNWVAKNRYKWFGRQKSCSISNGRFAYKFLG